MYTIKEDIPETKKRIKAIEKVLSKHFTLYSPLEPSLDKDGHYCYKNTELTVYDNLFCINIKTCLGAKFSCHNGKDKLYNNYNLKNK